MLLDMTKHTAEPHYVEYQDKKRKFLDKAFLKLRFKGSIICKISELVKIRSIINDYFNYQKILNYKLSQSLNFVIQSKKKSILKFTLKNC